MGQDMSWATWALDDRKRRYSPIMMGVMEMEMVRRRTEYLRMRNVMKRKIRKC